MSLITLRNTNGQSPSTFENDFNNTFEIEPNSEVALHSIALNRLPQYDISDKFFYVYHGVSIDKDGEPDTTNAFGGDNMYRLSEASLIKLSNGKYGYTELATEIQKQLRAQDRHPNYQQKWACTAGFSGDNNDVLDGMTIVCDQIPAVSDTPTMKVPTEVVATGDHPERTVFDYHVTGNNKGECENLDTDPFEDSYVRTQYPTNLNNGQAIIDFSGLVDLTTPDIEPRTSIGIGRNYRVPGSALDYSREFFDIKMTIVHQDSTETDDDGNVTREYKTGDVLLFQELYTSQQYKMYEIEYWEESGTGFNSLSVPMNLVNKPAGFTGVYNSLRFRFGNERIRIELGDSSNADPTKHTWTSMTSIGAKPISYANYAVYPKVFLPANKKCKFIHQDDRTLKIPRGLLTLPGYTICCSGLPKALPNHIACVGASLLGALGLPTMLLKYSNTLIVVGLMQNRASSHLSPSDL